MTAANYWPHAPLSEVAELITDGTHHSPTASPSGEFLYLTSKNVRTNHLLLDDVGYVDRAAHLEIHKRCPVRKGDVLLVKDGVNTGMAAENTLDVEFSLLSSVAIIRPRRDVLHPRFLVHWINSPSGQYSLTRTMSGSAIRRLILAEIKRKAVPLPPLVEQKRIADILDKADAIRRKRREAGTGLAQFPVSTFFEMFGDPRTNRRRWKVCQLKDVVADDDKINYGVVQPGEEHPGGVPIVRVGDLQNLRVSIDGLKTIDPDIERQYARSRLRGDEVLVSCVGSIGLVALADVRLKDFNIVRAIARIRCGDSIDRHYLAAYLATPAIQSYFQQSTRTVSQPTLNIKNIEETTVLLPPMPIQRRYADIVDAYHAALQRHENSRDEIDAVFQSLVQRAFRGNLCGSE